MKRSLRQAFLFIVCCTAVHLTSFAQGYYKDLFVDNGVKLAGLPRIAAGDSLRFSAEYISTDDSTIQYQVMVGNAYDCNGVLLYPDGEPRFRLLYTNGGYSNAHGKSLGEEGRERIREFYANGGSYAGSCAGAYIVSLGANPSDTLESFYHIWPGWTQATGLFDVLTGHFIADDSPLLKYSDFGGDAYIADIYHWGGCFARVESFPSGTEVLLTFDYPSLEMNGKPSCWAYKADGYSGRLVVIGSHPEYGGTGEHLQLMKAMFQYALDGSDDTLVKGELYNGRERVMDKSTEDNDPAHAKIGDKQYHHFTVNIPEGTNQLQVTLRADTGYHMNVFVRKDEFAFAATASYSDTTEASEKNISISHPGAATWYIGVECATTVEAARHNWGYEYTGKLGTLNGASYTILAEWDVPTGFADRIAEIHDFRLDQNYPNPFNPTTTIRYSLDKPSQVNLTVYNLLGQKIKTLVDSYKSAGEHSVEWNGTDDSNNPACSGIYFYRIAILSDNMESDGMSFQKKMLLIR